MPTPSVTVFHTLRLLERRLRPIYVYRQHREQDHVTVVVIDPRHLFADVCWAMNAQVTDEESNIARAALGWPPRGTPLSDFHTALLDRLWPLYVPAALRLPGEPALQGGVELLRRQVRGDLDYELDLLLRDEMQQTG